MSDGIPCSWYRGGTSKAAFFLASDLPASVEERDSVLLEIMGSPDPRQIDGIGGGNSLTSKVAIISVSKHPGIDVDYLFLQVFVDRAQVSDAQACGNILSAVGPFSIEQGLVDVTGDSTTVSIHMCNTNKNVLAECATPGGRISYRGNTRIDGVPGTHAAVNLAFSDIAGSSCGALLPTGNPVDSINGLSCTLIDNGMPTVLLRAADFQLSGEESCDALDSDTALRKSLERIRTEAGRMMQLGDVSTQSVPKMTLLSPARNGGDISTRTFIPHKCHTSIGVFGATTIAAACVTEGTLAAQLTRGSGAARRTVDIEHPSGMTSAFLELDAEGFIISSGMVRTARKLFAGLVFPRH